MKVAFNCAICQNGIADAEMYLETPPPFIVLVKNTVQVVTEI